MSNIAVITGGAGGIGLSLAAKLRQRGYELVLVDIDESRLAQAAARLGPGTRTLQADLGSNQGLSLVADFVAGDSRIGLLVNGAGIIRPGTVLEMSYEEMERHVAINLLAPMRLSQAAARAFAARRSGCILNLVSAAGLVALPGSAAYSASKFGLRGFLIALNQELAGTGVKVRGVFPGAVDTPMLRYEATHGGSVLNFLNKDVLSADQVAEACLRAIDGKRLETHLPVGDSISARILCALPGLMPRVLPYFQKQGEAGLQRFLKSRGLNTALPGSSSR
ncbi:MAG: SDR family NAD(P)-dependent oxidoreductase [Nevskia sp.]|nr:SDR family NAD(P)-dependent oxidoreductase [Nevskia sp.]